jgi:hypothetical protein
LLQDQEQARLVKDQAVIAPDQCVISISLAEESHAEERSLGRIEATPPVSLEIFIETVSMS